MAFHLRRLRDNVEEHGGRSEAIAWKEDGTFDKVVSHIPTVGCSILVGSVTARTYANQDYWLTTPVVEILEEIKDEDNHYIRFMTENSEYEWWNGINPKTNE
jgi:hypothetical protein